MDNVFSTRQSFWFFDVIIATVFTFENESSFFLLICYRKFNSWPTVFVLVLFLLDINFV